ncbi:NAD(P)/FAD-dependent oxidoreductase [Variovorax sp. J22R133]|uniref:NAD(P)/FAD-dependent oxidoreductase n=1 Tax=Variovorax brevis TaxID=3053503 RepID=UPI0025757CD9|nr:NAD(P)/FAD-dependent oxidoreductase [Variovorax sp. J22R133]MDM0113109.1 NAD(P)/FAD-dependent oxidoreductase [Variovorax sp. J22R133]
MTTQGSPSKPHIVIVGCGFGGLEAARALQDKDVDITVIEKTNHHLFQPLLYQVATAGLAAPSIAAPVRTLFRNQQNITTLMAEVSGFSPDTREVLLSDGHRVAYDHLLVAAGSTHSYFGNDHWAANAPGLKTLADAFNVRGKVLLSFEAAELERDPELRRGMLTFCVIGAGPTGVEMAGTLAEIARHTLSGEYRRFNPAESRVLLIEGGSRVLQAMPENLSHKALQQLEKLGVEVHLDTRVTAIDATGLNVQTGTAADGTPIVERIESRCVVWAAGVTGSPLGRILGETVGIDCDRAGRLPVEPDLSLAGHPEISVVGDLAAAMSHAKGKAPTPVPGVSPGAKQMGRTAAANILRRIEGKPTQAFHYADYGNLATIGRNAAVVDLGTPFGPLRFSGAPAWWFWLLAHAYFLIGFRNRLVVLMDWASVYRTYHRGARVVPETGPESVPKPET